MTVRGVIISTPASDARRSIRIFSAVVVVVRKRRPFGIFDRKIIERIIAVVPARERAPVDHTVDRKNTDIDTRLQRIDKAVVFCALRAERSAESRPHRIFNSRFLKDLSLNRSGDKTRRGKNHA